MRKVLVLPLLLWLVSAQAQQLPQMGHYIESPLLFNPAITGMHKWVDMSLGMRRQWAGFENAPRTAYLSAHSSIDKKKWGIGGYFFNDRNGLINNSGLNASYAYHLPVGDATKLSMGLSVAFSHYSFAANELLLTNPGDRLLTNAGSATAWTPDAGFGILLHRSDYYLGLSVLHLPKQSNTLFTQFDAGGSIPTTQHIYAIGQYRYEVNEDYELMPSFLVEVVPNAPSQYNLMLRAIYRDQFQGGLAYSSRDALSLHVGVVFLGDWQLNYSYGIPLTPLIAHSAGTNEITLQYDLYYKPIYKKLRRRYNLRKIKKGEEEK